MSKDARRENMSVIKKLICIVISVAILGMTFLPKQMIYADEDASSTMDSINNEPTIVNIEESYLRSGEMLLTFYFSDDSKLYTITDDDTIELYDESNILIGTAQFGIVDDADNFVPDVKVLEKIHSVRGASDYDQWRGWYNTSGTTYIEVNLNYNPTAGIIASLVFSGFKKIGITIMSAVVMGFAESIISQVINPSIIYAKSQWNYNKFCGILVKERLVKTNSNGSITSYGPAYHKWLESPWSYGTCEAECRVLTQIYP